MLSMRVSPLEKGRYRLPRAARIGPARGSMRVSPLENHSYTNTHKPRKKRCFYRTNTVSFARARRAQGGAWVGSGPVSGSAACLPRDRKDGNLKVGRDAWGGRGE